MISTGRPEPVVRIRLLGGTDVEVDGRGAYEVLAQPKRLALLAYLLLERGGGPLRRAELLRMFWPDGPEVRTRAALRQSLRFLRLHLGKEVITNRGDAEVGLRETDFSCDAVVVRRALSAGDGRRAVQAYAGELMPGFSLPAIPSFDDWLASERERLRRDVARAAIHLADAEADVTEGRSEAWLRRAMSLDPDNESVAHRLMEVYGRRGDAAAALEIFETLRRGLGVRLGASPSAATVRLAEALRSGAMRPAPAVSHDPASAGPPRVLAVPLENRSGDPSLEMLGRLAAETIAQGLASVPDLDVIPPLAFAGRAAAVDPRELARQLGADILIEGAYFLDRDGIFWQVRISDLAAGRLMPGPGAVGSSRETPLEGIVELRDAVMRVLVPALSPRVVHARQAAHPPTLEAYSAYAAGMERFVAGRWRAALEHFQRSADLASDYALPRLVSAIALWNLGELYEAKAAAAEAARTRTTLGRFEGAVLDMVRAWLGGDWAAAHRAAQLQAELAPSSIPHFQVAEEARRLNRPREALRVLSRLDPERGELAGWIYYWVEITTASHMIGDHERELELATRCRRLHPYNLAAVLLVARALAALGDDGAVERLADEALAWPGAGEPSAGHVLYEAALELGAHGCSAAGEALMARAVECFRVQSGVMPSPSHQRALGRALYHLGHLDEARDLFSELAATGPAGVPPASSHHAHLQAHLDVGYLTLISTRTGDTAGAAEHRDALLRMDLPFLYGANWFWLAADAAVRNRTREAVQLLRRALVEGLPFESFLHTDVHLQRLRGDPQFEALMRPVG